MQIVTAGMPREVDAAMGPRDLSRGEGARILVVEDDPELRALLVLTLGEDGYEVDEVADGRQFVEVMACLYEGGLLAESYSLIISDIRMPGYSGLDVLSALRCLRSHVPVIIITAFGDEATRRLAFGLGAMAVLDKPFDLDDLRTVVMNALADRRASGGLTSPLGWV